MKRQDYCTSSSSSLAYSLLSCLRFILPSFFGPNSLTYLRISYLLFGSRSISLSIIITIYYSSTISDPLIICPLSQPPTPSRSLTSVVVCTLSSNSLLLSPTSLSLPHYLASSPRTLPLSQDARCHEDLLHVHFQRYHGCSLPVSSPSPRNK